MARQLIRYLLIVLGWSIVLTLTNLIIMFEGFFIPIPKDICIFLMSLIINMLAGFIIADLKKTVVCYIACIALMLIITYEVFMLPLLLGVLPVEFGELLSMTAVLNIRKGLFLILPLAFFESLVGSLFGEHMLKV